MAVSRRRLLALGAGAAAGGFWTAGCGSQRSLGDSDEITLWTWDRSVSDELVARAETRGIPGAEGFRISRTNNGGHFNTKVRTALAGKSLVPDIIGVNSDVATYFPNQDVSVDLNDFGAAELKSRYLGWKWNECITPEGRMIAFPMDTGPTGLFRMRQYAQGAIADELIQASRVDGAGFFRQWRTVGLPVLRPGLVFLGIFTFFHIWNDYLWPLTVMTDPGEVTLQVAAQRLNGVYTTDQSMVIAGALMSVIPLIGVFLIGSRHFIANLAAGSMSSEEARAWSRPSKSSLRTCAEHFRQA
ncbi:ABC transporter permease subunit [Streptomyces sp. NPDC088801]|uniref:ABC transporter permease subunit n=1 Tax=Streptomyces sp. NPDC088801 TaxID=3365903 RepID=UPI0037F5AE6E